MTTPADDRLIQQLEAARKEAATAEQTIEEGTFQIDKQFQLRSADRTLVQTLQPLPDITMADQTESRGKILLNKPNVFDRDKTKFKKWIRQTYVYISHPKNGLTTDEDKIMVCLSYMRGEQVDEWVDWFWEEHIEDLVVKRTLKEFLELLKERFTDANQQRKAQAELELLSQGKDSAETYFQKFEILLKLAGYSKANSNTLCLLEQGVNFRTIKNIYSSGNLPDSFDTYKKRVIELDNLRNQLAENKCMFTAKVTANQNQS